MSLRPVAQYDFEPVRGINTYHSCRMNRDIKGLTLAISLGTITTQRYVLEALGSVSSKINVYIAQVSVIYYLCICSCKGMSNVEKRMRQRQRKKPCPKRWPHQSSHWQQKPQKSALLLFNLLGCQYPGSARPNATHVHLCAMP